MRYKLTIFHATWEISTNVPVDSKVVCRGPYPNDPEDSFKGLQEAWRNALKQEKDLDVLLAMGDWAK